MEARVLRAINLTHAAYSDEIEDRVRTERRTRREHAISAAYDTTEGLSSGAYVPVTMAATPKRKHGVAFC
jgi:hypothetical protein